MRGGPGIALASLLLLGGCRKSADEQQREAVEATRRAEEKAREATLTSGILEQREAAAAEAQEAKDEALREQGEALLALRREQLKYRGRLQKRLDELDRALAVVRQEQLLPPERSRSTDPHTAALIAQREALTSSAAALERSTQQDWPALKARIDRELSTEQEP